MSYIVGIDIGGTNIKAGVLSEEGEILVTRSIKTESSRGSDNCFDRITILIEEMLDTLEISKKDVLGVGLGIPGPVVNQEIVSFFANFPWEKDLNVRKALEERTGLKVKLDNDVNIITLGEYWQGAAKGYENVLGVAIGTGIGGGIISNGNIVSGFSGAGGEVGHIVIEPNGKLCGCGSKGCWEAYASATGLEREAKSRLVVNKNNMLWNKVQGKELEAKDIFDAAKEGDAFSLDLVDYEAEKIAHGLGIVLSITNPEIVVMGGGVSLAGDFLFDKVKEKIATYAFKPSLNGIQIIPATLGNNAGVVGAAALFANK